MKREKIIPIILVVIAVFLSSCDKNLFNVCVVQVKSDQHHLVSDEILQEMGYRVSIIENSGEFQIFQYETDQYGSHVRCHQFYQGLPIFLGDVNFIFVDGVSIMGDVIDSINISTTPKIGFQKAAELVHKIINSKDCYNAELGFFDKNAIMGINEKDVKLCWKISEEDNEYLYVIIDAQTGSVLYSDDGIRS